MSSACRNAVYRKWAIYFIIQILDPFTMPPKKTSDLEDCREPGRRLGGTKEFTTTEIRWGGRRVEETLEKIWSKTHRIQSRGKERLSWNGKIRDEVPEGNELVCPLFVSDACSHTRWQIQNVFHRIWPAIASWGGGDVLCILPFLVCSHLLIELAQPLVSTLLHFVWMANFYLNYLYFSL